jgi:hypothetical protein
VIVLIVSFTAVFIALLLGQGFLSQLRLQSTDPSQSQLAQLFTMRLKHLYYQIDTNKVSV